MPFFGSTPAGPAPQPGGVPGQVRNTRANYPPAGTGAGEANPTLGYGLARPAQRVVTASPVGVFNNGPRPGAIGPTGYQGGAAGTVGEIGGNKLFRQLRRQMRPGEVPPEVAPAVPPMQPDPADPTGANRPGFEYRRDRRQAARMADGTPVAPPPEADPTGAGRAGYEWRDARRQANRQGLISQNEDGSYSPVGATPGPGGPPNFATGADRAGMGWRADRRAAKAAGLYPNGAPKGGAPGAPVA